MKSSQKNKYFKCIIYFTSSLTNVAGFEKIFMVKFLNLQEIIKKTLKLDC